MCSFYENLFKLLSTSPDCLFGTGKKKSKKTVSDKEDTAKGNGEHSK